MVHQYISFGYPDTILGPLVGFDLEDTSPLDGLLTKIIIYSPSEFVAVHCILGGLTQILPLTGDITIRDVVEYPIEKKVTARTKIAVSLENHDPLFTHTPSVVWEFEDILSEVEVEKGRVLAGLISEAISKTEAEKGKVSANQICDISSGVEVEKGRVT